MSKHVEPKSVMRHRVVGGVSVPCVIPSGGKDEAAYILSSRMNEATILLRRHFTITKAVVTQAGDSGFHYKLDGEIIPKFVSWEDAKGGRF